MPVVDVVVVAYNSRDVLRPCVEPLLHDEDFGVIVVDNASPDGSAEAVRELPLGLLEQAGNFGFAHACNRGWEAGSAPYVLFLNPDARIQPESLRRLLAVLENNERCGVVAPRIVDAEGKLEHSLRRRPRLVSTYSQALFLHRLFPEAPWTDELIRDPRAYAEPTVVEWVSGACVLTRRSVLEEIGGWDEDFFLYGEDVDICRRVWTAGYEVRYEPNATAVHIGGTSAPSDRMAPRLIEGRIRYVKKHEPALVRVAAPGGSGSGCADACAAHDQRNEHARRPRPGIPRCTVVPGGSGEAGGVALAGPPVHGYPFG